MGDSAMSMMSGPHGDLGPAHCRKLQSKTAAKKKKKSQLSGTGSLLCSQACTAEEKLSLIQPD